MLRLGVLDHSPIADADTASAALRQSVDLARQAECFGYHRFWASEHHGLPGMAGSSPEILIAHVASQTDQIRVGTGGILLAYTSPLRLADSFATLEALHPRRLDLGVARGPGAEGETLAALSARSGPSSYETKLEELVALLYPIDDPSRTPLELQRTPNDTLPPPLFVLASSHESTTLAARLGLPVAWAHWLTSRDAAPLLARYRAEFRASRACSEPDVLVGVNVVCGSNREDASRLAREWPDASFHGTPALVREALCKLGEHLGASEVLVRTRCRSHDDRVRSYQLLAAAFGLEAR